MPNLPGLSLGSRCWDKASAVTLIQRPLHPGGTSFESPVPNCWAGIFGKALEGSNPLCEWVLAKFEFRETVRFIGEEGEERSSKIFDELLWLSRGLKREAVAELQNQPGSKSCLRLLSCGTDFFFGQSVEVVPRQTNTIRKAVRPSVRWLWTYALSQLAGPFYILKMWLCATSQVLQVISRRLGEHCPCKELCLFIFWSFKECVSKFSWRIPGGLFLFISLKTVVRGFQG